MKHKIKQMLPVFEYLCASTVSEQMEHIRCMHSSYIQFLIDLLFNIECGQFAVSPEIVKKLKKQRKTVDSLIKRRKSLKRRREELCCKGVFCSIYVPLLPVLQSFAQNGAF